MLRRVHLLLLFGLLLAAAADWTSLAPGERFLGSGIRIVYPHGAWVWASLASSLAGARQVMHPPSPVFSSESVALRVFSMGPLSLCLLAGWQLTGWLRIRTG